MKRFHALSAIGALMLGHVSSATITVSPAGYYTPSGSDITINAQAAPHDTEFIIEAEPGDFIGDIVINTPTNPQSPHRIRLNIWNKGTPTNGFNTTIGVDGVRNISVTGDGEVWLGNVFIRGELGFLTPEGVPTGLVRVNVISGTLRVRRNILADVEAIGTFGFTPPSGQVINSIVVPQDSDSNPLCIGCDQNDRSITGSIRAFNGGIGSINAYNELGLVDEQIVSQGPVGAITAGSLTGVAITMPNYDLGSLVANRGGWGGDNTVGDDGVPGAVFTFPGSVEARKINIFQLKKDMQSDLKVSFGPTGGQVWKIGGSLTSTGLLEFTQNNQLKHQIVIGEQATGGTWNSGGQVKVGASPPYALNALYNTLPGNLGNGSVGAAPYAIHTKATSPEPFKTASIGYLDYSSFEVPPPCVNDFAVRIEYYGRIEVTGTPTTAVIVWEAPKVWDGLDPLNPNYESTPDLPDPIEVVVTASASGRRLTLSRSSGDWSINKTYRVEIQPNRIKNLDLVNSGGGSPTYSPAFAYWFKTSNGCEGMFDLNSDGSLNGVDAATWLVEPVNFNQDNVPNVEDLDILLRGIDEHGDE